MKEIIDDAFTKPCRKCDGPTYLSAKYDAEFCPFCRKWVDPGCGDPTCEYCAQRPKKPSLRLTRIGRDRAADELLAKYDAERSKA